MVVSLHKGTPIWTPNTIILTLETHWKMPSILGKPHISVRMVTYWRGFLESLDERDVGMSRPCINCFRKWLGSIHSKWYFPKIGGSQSITILIIGTHRKIPPKSVLSVKRLAATCSEPCMIRAELGANSMESHPNDGRCTMTSFVGQAQPPEWTPNAKNCLMLSWEWGKGFWELFQIPRHTWWRPCPVHFPECLIALCYS